MSKTAELKKERRQNKAKSDPSQICFGSSGELKLQPQVKAQVTEIPLEKSYLCPFCLVEAKLTNFLISNKDGISHSKAECKLCGQGMMMRNLMRPWTAEQYASWVFGYRGFFKKDGFNFAAWRQRLIDLGWSLEFWSKYKALKAEARPWETEIKKSDYFTEDADEHGD
jgi:transcription elongation factor Elf1